MKVIDLGTIGYRDAWALQEEAHGRVMEGGEETLFLLEHRPVITFGRRAGDSAKNLIASKERLAEMGVEVVESDRGGDITFHGPGQLVAYPIVRLNGHGLSVGGYVRRLEEVVIATLKRFGIEGFKDDCAIGVWVGERGAACGGGGSAKICALGVRIKRGISMHGIALNVTTDLGYFDLINPCGLGRPVTSMRKELGERAPAMSEVKIAFSKAFGKIFSSVI